MKPAGTKIRLSGVFPEMPGHGGETHSGPIQYRTRFWSRVIYQGVQSCEKCSLLPAF